MHLRPELHLFKGAATALAQRITLAGGADGNAGRVRRAGIPVQPSRPCRLRQGGLFHQHGMRIDHARIDLRQRPGVDRQRHPIGRGLALAPEVDGRFDVGDVDACQCWLALRGPGKDADDSLYGITPLQAR